MRQFLLKRISAFSLLLLSVILFTPSQVSAATVGIDNFNDLQEVCDPTTGCTPAVSSSSASTTNAVGGTRDMTVTRSSGSNTVSAKSSDAGDYFSYSAGNFTSGNFQVVWDGDSDPATLDHTGLSGLDLTGGGSNSDIFFREVYSDLEFTLRMEIYTDATNWSHGELTIPAGTTGQNFSIPFTSFTTGGGSGADFSNVGAILMTQGGTPVTALDFSLDYMAADAGVPLAVGLAQLNTSVDPQNSQLIWVILGLLIIPTTVYLFRKRGDWLAT